MKAGKHAGKIAATLVMLFAAGEALAVGRLADVSIFDRTEGRMLQVYPHQGRYYVVGKPGNEYQVTVRNQAGTDVLAVLSVDGVNIVSGETANAAQTGYVVDQWQNLEVKGWRTGLARTAAFYFTTLADSYATRTGRPDNVGVIGAALFRRKPAEPPVDLSWSAPYKRQHENAARDSAAPESPGAQPAPSTGASAEGKLENRAKSLGTGYGRGETSYARHVAFERATPAPEEVISIHYDSHANLVARGIIRATPRHEPQPFPAGFVAEPPRDR
jgi:hypothetical protein